ncbi:RNA-directed DNA polymerase from mobile element jockey [Drosophila virilis]|uniref:RNA-directed DNA polymerase from mobile element jockey n=1 Tax=Drosophila virilis TaxID=7244 RepID=UPI0038B2D1F2
MATQLRLGSWNARGILQNANELKLFLKKHDVDIMLISETHLHTNLYLTMEGYVCYRADHPTGRARGGAVVLAKQDLAHYHLHTVTSSDTQLAAIMVETPLGEILVAAAYLPPNIPWNRAEFDSLFGQLGPKFIVGGDFNAKHRLVLSVREEYDLSSDHLPLLTTINTAAQRIPKKRRLVLPGSNIQRFKAELNSLINLNTQILSVEDVDAAVQTLLDQVHAAAANAAPAHIYSAPTSQRPRTFSPILEGLLALKKRLRREYVRTQDPTIDRIYRRIANRVRKELIISKRNATDTMLEEATADESSKFALWKLSSRYKRQAAPKFPVRLPDDTWARSPMDRAEAFACNLEERFKPFETASHARIQRVAQILEAPLQMSLPVSPITFQEVEQEMKRLKSSKAPGEDRLDNQTIKLLPYKAVLFLVAIFNAALRLGYFPVAWKKAHIIMLHKSGKPPNQLGSYRPISLLPAFGKILEWCILRRVLDTPEIKRLIPKFQFGFRLKHEKRRQRYKHQEQQQQQQQQHQRQWQRRRRRSYKLNAKPQPHMQHVRATERDSVRELFSMPQQMPQQTAQQQQQQQQQQQR